MKRIIAITCFGLAAFLTAPSQSKSRRAFKDIHSPAASKVEHELIKAENEEIDAVSRHDADTLRRVLADEFTFVGSRSTGERTHKDRYIESAFKLTWNSYGFSDFFIRVYDRTAVVNCRFSRQTALEGRDSTSDFLFTDVWVKRASRWQLVARHSTQIH